MKHYVVPRSDGGVMVLTVALQKRQRVDEGGNLVFERGEPITEVPYEIDEEGNVVLGERQPMLDKAGEPMFRVGAAVMETYYPDVEGELAKMNVAEPGRYLSAREIEGPDDLPQKDEFRPAWRDTGSTVVVDFAQAKEITKGRLRIERASLFVANDIAIRDALITQDQQKIAAATTERDRLRDVTKLADSAKDLQALKEITAGKPTADAGIADGP